MSYYENLTEYDKTKLNNILDKIKNIDWDEYQFKTNEVSYRIGTTIPVETFAITVNGEEIKNDEHL